MQIDDTICDRVTEELICESDEVTTRGCRKSYSSGARIPAALHWTQPRCAAQISLHKIVSKQVALSCVEQSCIELSPSSFTPLSRKYGNTRINHQSAPCTLLSIRYCPLLQVPPPGGTPTTSRDPQRAAINPHTHEVRAPSKPLQVPRVYVCTRRSPRRILAADVVNARPEEIFRMRCRSQVRDRHRWNVA